MNLKAVRQKEADLLARGRKLFETADKEKRELTAEEMTEDDKIHAEIEDLQPLKARLERAQEYERTVVATADPNDPNLDEETRRKAQGNHEWKTGGEFFSAVQKAGAGLRLSEREHMLLYGATASGASEGVAGDGGFLVNKQIQTEILRRMYDVGEVLSRVSTVPIGEGFNGIRIPSIDETSRATGSRYGGVQGYWLAEADTKTGSKPKFFLMELVLKKLAALFYATDELLQDTMALESLIMQVMPEEIRFLVEDAIIEGTGAGQPRGILNSSALISITKETGQAAATILFENIEKMWTALWGPSRKNAVWFYNSEAHQQLAQMSMKVGTAGVPVWMPMGGISGAPYETLMGRPMIPIEYCSALGTAGDIILADLGEYQFIDKGGIQQAASIHVRFINDETTYRFVYRCDGQSKWRSALTPFKGSVTRSPFVVIGNR